MRSEVTDLRGKTLLGMFFHAPELGSFEILEHSLVAIDAAGVIEAVLTPEMAGYEEALRDAGDRLCRTPPGSYVLPGFVDLHVHAPQYPQLGQALDEPLEVWLHKYTFPLEARYAALDFARSCYDALVSDLLSLGTTTALYFATVHVEATCLLADICLRKGQRALVGKVVMDDPVTCPAYYRDPSPLDALAGTRALIDHIRFHPDNAAGRVLPVVTPRFIPSCTDEALEGLGEIARDRGCHVQTHCSESDWAHGYVLERHGRTDVESLDGFGLLSRHTVLAHANFIADTDMARIAERGAGIAHCALSNMYFANSVFPLRRALEKGIHVGLGTDISGGPSASMFDACRTTVQASRVLEDGTDPAKLPELRGRKGSRVDIVTAFHLATAGGASALDLPVGRFAVGRRFDAMLVDTAAAEGTIRLFGEQQPGAVLEKLLYTASRPNLAAVWVDGRLVASGRRSGTGIELGRSA
jgi:guanine deaminase